MSKTLISIFLALTLGASGASQAAPVIDQNAPTDNAGMAFLSQTDIAQSFKQSASNIAGAGFYISQGRGEVTYSLFDNLNGNLLTSATGTVSSAGWFDLFWAPLSIVADQTYYLVVTGAGNILLDDDVLNGYSRGQVYANSGFGSFPTYDYTFRTYADDVGVGNGVPEPASIALALGGLCAAGAARRRAAAR